MSHESKPEQPEKAPGPIELIVDGSVTEVKPEQLKNAESQIEVTDAGITTAEVNLEQPLKAFFPIEATEEGMLHESKLEQSLKAEVPIEIIPEGRVIEVKLEQL